MKRFICEVSETPTSLPSHRPFKDLIERIRLAYRPRCYMDGGADGSRRSPYERSFAPRSSTKGLKGESHRRYISKAIRASVRHYSNGDCLFSRKKVFALHSQRQNISRTIRNTSKRRKMKAGKPLGSVSRVPLFQVSQLSLLQRRTVDARVKAPSQGPDSIESNRATPSNQS